MTESYLQSSSPSSSFSFPCPRPAGKENEPSPIADLSHAHCGKLVACRLLSVLVGDAQAKEIRHKRFVSSCEDLELNHRNIYMKKKAAGKVASENNHSK